MLIRVNDVIGLKPNDLESINNLNHYIGTEPNSIPELRIMPFVVSGRMALGLAAAAIGRRWMARAWGTGLCRRCHRRPRRLLQVGDDYGHDLDLRTRSSSVE